MEPEMAGAMSDDDFSDDMGRDAPMPSSSSTLPDGVKKEILTEVEGEWKTPKDGDEVFVHYVGTLESGEEFDSSRSRGKPFNFELGRGSVIKGWDVGVKTMKKGEVAKLTLSPEFAYGAAGSPPKIPENATLIFEIELLSWVSKSDLFQDAGVIKDLLTEGSGWKKPKEGDEVRLTLKACEKDGESVIEEKVDLEYMLGSGSLSTLGTAVDKALMEMKKGEEAKLTCTSAYSYAEKPDGAVIHLNLQEIYETSDISFAKDKTLMKKQVCEGQGYEKAGETGKVQLKVDAATDGTVSLPGFTATTLAFAAGNGEVCDALELVAMDMKKGEKCMLTCLRPAICAEEKLGLSKPSSDKVVFTLEMVDFEKAKDSWSMDEDEKLGFGAARKEVGSDLFRKGRLELALGRYKKVGELFNYVDNLKEENKSKAKELKKLAELNQAACHLKLKNFEEAKKSCNNVIKDDPSNVKALFRRAQCDIEFYNFQECLRDLKKVIEIEPQNKAARALLQDAKAGQKKEDQKAKATFANMCKALGKGPIPEPYKEKRPVDDFDDEEEGDDMDVDVEKPEDTEVPKPDEAEAPKTDAEAETPKVDA